eukprot:CAMPEP_0172518698 /NCGR_PEP_ID=MMETSP1066-20121228/290972_1 /TAXON_ID=671091 /ORGANISM="Coscinodiscus wailesii, Strain CCMP2513" /LENGTH=39 /DNA_ID= /DNA_START= /DNA_END= /DNA_ORIENTATION=
MTEDISGDHCGNSKNEMCSQWIPCKTYASKNSAQQMFKP